MLFILGIASLVGFFFYNPLFVWGGVITLFIWLLKYIFAKEPFLPSDMDEEAIKTRAITMGVSRLIMFLVIAGVLYFFFKWNGVAWLGISVGILMPKAGYSWQK